MQNQYENRDDQFVSDYDGQAQRLDKSQKIAVVVLAFFAIFVIVFWVTQTRNNLKSPFKSKATVVSEEKTCEGDDCSDEEMKNKDSDNDGLSDYDELNVYNTSPYIEDSDSDGYDDKNEISSQNDPNCPFGQVCYVEPVIVDETDPSIPDVYGAGDMQEEIFGEVDATTIRGMLLESGMEAEVLDQFSDQDLMNSFQELVNEEQ